jgi:signal peptidase II
MFGRYFDPRIADSQSPTYSPQSPHWWIDGVFGIQTSTNPGALFGMGSGYSWLFALFSVAAFIGILTWIFLYGGLRDRWLTFSLGLICGGILGNLYDRVGLGYLPTYPSEIKNNVRDWILFRLEGVRFFDPWPNFNIADACLVCGAIMLFVHAFCYAEPARKSEDPTTAT